MTAEYIYNITRRLIMDARDGKNSVTAEEIAGRSPTTCASPSTSS